MQEPTITSIKYTSSCLMKYHECYSNTPWWFAQGMDFWRSVPSIKMVHCVFELGELWPICKNGLCSECLEKRKCYLDNFMVFTLKWQSIFVLFVSCNRLFHAT